MKRDDGLVWWGISLGRLWRRLLQTSRNSWLRSAKLSTWVFLCETTLYDIHTLLSHFSYYSLNNKTLTETYLIWFDSIPVSVWRHIMLHYFIKPVSPGLCQRNPPVFQFSSSSLFTEIRHVILPSPLKWMFLCSQHFLEVGQWSRAASARASMAGRNKGKRKMIF